VPFGRNSQINVGHTPPNQLLGHLEGRNAVLGREWIEPTLLGVSLRLAVPAYIFRYQCFQIHSDLPSRRVRNCSSTYCIVFPKMVTLCISQFQSHPNFPMLAAEDRFLFIAPENKATTIESEKRSVRFSRYPFYFLRFMVVSPYMTIAPLANPALSNRVRLLKIC